jgi:hypothetical protein
MLKFIIGILYGPLESIIYDSVPTEEFPAEIVASEGESWFALLAFLSKS